MSADSSDSDDDDNFAIVIDNGSESIVAGTNLSELPNIFINSMVGTPKRCILEYGYWKKITNKKTINVPIDVLNIISHYYYENTYVGNTIKLMETMLNISYPIQNGLFTNWDHIEKIWQHIFDKVQKSPQEHVILLTHDPFITKKDKQTMIETMFESFNSSRMMMATRQLLALASFGKPTGLIVHCGHDTSVTVPIYEGWLLPKSIFKSSVAGKQITNYLDKLLQKKGYSLSRSILRDIKINKCFVSNDYYGDIKKVNNSTDLCQDYKLPDGKVISLNQERFECTEVLFNPKLMGFDDKGIGELAGDSIRESHVDIRHRLTDNVYLCGGTTLFENMKQRIRHGIGSKVSCDWWPNIKLENHREYATWRGGSIMSSLSSFQEMPITKEYYNENGASICLRQCTW